MKLASLPIFLATYPLASSHARHFTLLQPESDHSSAENFSVKLDGQQCACTSTLEINDIHNLTNMHQCKEYGQITRLESLEMTNFSAMSMSNSQEQLHVQPPGTIFGSD